MLKAPKTLKIEDKVWIGKNLGLFKEVAAKDPDELNLKVTLSAALFYDLITEGVALKRYTGVKYE